MVAYQHLAIFQVGGDCTHEFEIGSGGFTHWAVVENDLLIAWHGVPVGCAVFENLGG
jgi:hypothetical protein